jgi:flagellin-like hook-associated protein FlgL
MITSKPSLLAVAVATLGAVSASQVSAAPFMPMDARGLAMGNTGVASAKRAHAPAYNPSLLSKSDADDDFALLLGAGGSISDEDEIADVANDISDNIVPELERLLDDAESNTIADAIDSANAAIDTIETELNRATPSLSTITAANSDLGTALADIDAQLADLNSTTSELDNALNSISGSPLSGTLGGTFALAFPGKKFAAALHVAGNAHFSGRMLFSGNDSNLLQAYGTAAGDYVEDAQSLQSDMTTIVNSGDSDADQITALEALEADVDALATYNSDPVDTASGTIRIIENGEVTDAADDADLDSQVQVVGLSVVDVGLAFARDFTISGQQVAVGITPKYQSITTFHFVTEVDNEEDIDESDFEDATEEYNQFNLDLGASWAITENGKWIAGLVGKNLLGGSFDTADAEVRGSSNPLLPAVEGTKVEITPQYRAGLAYNGEWTSIAIDLDLVENDPVAYESATQFAAVGAEFDVFSFLQLRAGYRTNLAASNAEVVSAGLGLSPFELFHIDLALLANPNKVEKEFGAAAELGFYF